MNDLELHVPAVTGDSQEASVDVAQPQEAQLGEEPSPTAESTPETALDNTAASEAPQNDTPAPAADVTEIAQAVFGPGKPKPIAVSLHLRPTDKPGHFHPAASIEIDPALRTSGLLAAMSADDVKTLVALLTFLSPNGDIKPTAYEVAQGLNVSEGKAKEWLKRLARFRWQSRPLVTTLWRESGMDGYTLCSEFVSYREADRPSPGGIRPAYRAAGRDAVIAHSRAHYTRPRAEVERQIAMMQGWPLPEEDASSPVSTTLAHDISPEEYLRQRLFRLGVTHEQVELLMSTFPPEEIEQQIAWLPYRGAKNPASYLVAAITGSYAEPGLLKLKREIEAESGPDIRASGSQSEAV